MPVTLDPILNHVPAWLMVMFRITGIFVIAPVLGSNTIPGRIKILFALVLSFCVYPMLLTPGKPSAGFVGHVVDHGMSMWAMGGAVAMELLLGIVIGYGATLPIIAMQTAGHIVDQQMGMGLGGLFNPELNDDGTVSSQFFFILAMMIFMIIGGHRILLATVIGSYDNVPLGGFRVDGHVLDLLIGMLAAMFDLAFRIAAPLLCIVFLETIAMGFIARTVPQMNILSIGFPLRIMVGIGILVVSTATIAMAATGSMRQALNQLSRFFGV
ncbi:MAG: flagellar biosynthetic protein FliR [Phycisphaeraceae bacterium]